MILCWIEESLAVIEFYAKPIFVSTNKIRVLTEDQEMPIQSFHLQDKNNA